MYKEEDIRKYLEAASGRSIIKVRDAIDKGQVISRLKTENEKFSETIKQQSEMLSSHEKMRSRADFLERKEIIQKKLNTLHKTSGSVHILGLMKGTNITVATYSYCYNSKVAIILATPDNELYAIPFHPKLGTVGMKATATNCRDREYHTNISANNIVIKSIRIAEAIMTITPPARGSSYSGEKELTEEEKRELKEAGKAGALDATFEDFRFVERLA